jgi:hypothetical protein
MPKEFGTRNPPAEDQVSFFFPVEAMPSCLILRKK